MINMEQETLNQELANELISIKGEARGLALKSYGEFILQKKGQKGLERIEERLSGLGYPIKYQEIKPMDFYPIGMVALTLLAAKDELNFETADFLEMGRYGSKVPMIMRIFMKYLGSLDKVIQEVPGMWRKYYTVGDLEVTSLDKEKRRLTLRLNNFSLHPIYCRHIPVGYFPFVLQMVIKSPVTCKETKCVHKGDDCHEYLMEW